MKGNVYLLIFPKNENSFIILGLLQSTFYMIIIGTFTNLN